MNFNFIMSILIDKSLEVLWDILIHLIFLGFENVKINAFGEKYFWVHFCQIEVQVFTSWSR